MSTTSPSPHFLKTVPNHIFSIISNPTPINHSNKKKNKKKMMGEKMGIWVMVFVVCFAMGMCSNDDSYEVEKRERDDDMFLLQDSKHVFKTDAGNMKVMRSGFGAGAGAGRWIVERPMHIGFISMEPKTLFLPQYVDSNLIIFIRRGEAKIGSIYKDELVERQLKMGDVYRVPAGSAFYLVNTGEGQRLHVICSIDNSEGLGVGAFQSFFIGGGTNPASILSGFDHRTLATAFNVSTSELKDLLTAQDQGPIVYISDSGKPSIWANFLNLKQQEKVKHLKKMVDFEEDDEDQENEKQQRPTWSWRKMLNTVFGEENVKTKSKSGDSYNLYDRKPDFKNNYGWSMAVDQHDYSPLKHSGIGIYLVNLTAGSMMAPHVNPTATEYGVVLRGTGSIQIVFPNGSLAMNAQVKEGDVFWVPKYFPFCQIASRTGPLEFFGFTTSARRNRPQFLAGASSVLHTMRGPEIAEAFGVSLKDYDRVIGAQSESIILPTPNVVPPEMKGMGDDEKMARIPEVVRSFSHDMLMGFD